MIDHIPASAVPPECAPYVLYDDFSTQIVMDARWRGHAETACAPQPFRDRLLSACSRTVLNDAEVHVGRVRFQKTNFEFDEDGRWALLLPVWDDREIVDLGAFDLDDHDMRRPLFGAFAVGFELARWDSLHHPKRRLLVHFDPWSYLRSECVGVLPISWRRFGIELVQWKIPALVYPDDLQARRADARLAAVLRVPPSFVKSATEAA